MLTIKFLFFFGDFESGNKNLCRKGLSASIEYSYEYADIRTHDHEHKNLVNW